MSRHVFALLAVVSLATAVGLWYLFNQTSVESLKLGANLELNIKKTWTRSSARRPSSTTT